jgi:hypothetical protein
MSVIPLTGKLMDSSKPTEPKPDEELDPESQAALEASAAYQKQLREKREALRKAQNEKVVRDYKLSRKK